LGDGDRWVLAQYENPSELRVALRVIIFFGFSSGCPNFASQCRCRPSIVVKTVCEMKYYGILALDLEVYIRKGISFMV